jgi:Lamin Tail Domain
MSAGKWLLVILLNIVVSAITGLIVVRVITQEPGQLTQVAPAAPVATTAPVAPVASIETPASAATPVSAPVASIETPVVAAEAAPTQPAAPVAAGNAQIRISSVQFPGQRTREAVSILNEGERIDMTGWQLSSPSGQTYTFNSFVLFKDSFITLYTTNGSDSPTSLFWNQGEAVWKSGDTVTLKNGDTVIATYTVR